MSIKLYLKRPKNRAEATARATALKNFMNKKMNTTKWRAVVFDNLGWNYNLQAGSISLYYDENSQTFHALVGDIKGEAMTGLAAWATAFRSSDPVSAVKKSVAEAETYTLKLLDTINSNRKILNQPIYKVLGIYREPGGKQWGKR